MKKILFLVLFLIGKTAFAQNSFGSSDDAARISLNIFIPEQSDQLTENAESLLRDRISLMMTNYSLTSSNANGRFILVPVVSVLGKEITSTVPAMTVISIQTSLYIGDGYQGIKFYSTSITSKGVGQNENKAYIDAIKKIKLKDDAIQKFIDNGKKKILEYYNSTCDFNIKKAESLANQNSFDEALFLLSDVPEVAKSCFDRSQSAALPIFKKMIDFNCAQSLNRARLIWSSRQDMSSAESVAEILSSINPGASCYNEANEFVKSISKRVLELDKREWAFKLRQQQLDADVQIATIKAIRDIGVAYGNGQPKTIYNNNLIRTWW